MGHIVLQRQGSIFTYLYKFKNNHITIDKTNENTRTRLPSFTLFSKVQSIM